ncbi:MAG: S8 family serine peptidase [Oligoflexia bacterium]|nr:S8 family serine peptidase [Oligoflexia bacterium]
MLGLAGKLLVFLFSINSSWANWNYDRIGVDWAHQHGFKGQGQKIAILDTGYTKKSELNIKGYNFVHNNPNFNDDHGHGSHITNIISSIVPQAELHALKVIDLNGDVYPQAVAKAIEYAISNSIKIINCSWYVETTETRESFKLAQEAGILVVVAADNDGKNLDIDVGYPASFNFNNMLNIAATTNNDKLTIMSSWGRKFTHIGAPGENILAGGKVMSGTSQAAAHVSGAAALIWQKYKNANYSEIKNKIISSADVVEHLEHKTYSGGIINIKNAFQGLTNPKREVETKSWIKLNKEYASAHPVLSDQNQVFRIHQPGAKYLKVNFEKIDLDPLNEFILIGHEDENHNPYYYEKITGKHSNYQSVYVPGDKMIIILSSKPEDNYTPGWGFKISSIEY